MATKLTNHLRNEIHAGVMKHRFGAEVLAEKERWFDFAEEIYNASYPPALQAQMEALPNGFLPTSDSVCFLIHDGERKHTHRSHNIPMRHRRRTSQNCQYGNALLTVNAKSKIDNKLRELSKAATDFADIKNKVEGELRSALASFTTVEKLIAGWPEVKPFIPAIEVANRQLPVPIVSELNKTFKLPVKKGRAAKLAVAA